MQETTRNHLTRMPNFLNKARLGRIDSTGQTHDGNGADLSQNLHTQLASLTAELLLGTGLTPRERAKFEERLLHY